MKKMELTENWHFCGVDTKGSENVKDLVQLVDSFSGWLPIDVPGDINQALVKHGKVPDPSYDANAKESYYWIYDKEWWYKLDFKFTEKNLENPVLSFDCIDGVADLWFNREYLGCVKNAFRPFQFNIDKNTIRENNELVLRFRSFRQLLDGPAVGEQPIWNERGAYIRKVQYNFGWDWALSLPSMGIAGNVLMELDHARKFTDYSVKPFCDGRLDFAFEVTTEARQAGYRIDVNVYDEDENISYSIERGTNKAGSADCSSALSGGTIDGSTNKAYKSYCSLNIKNPKLWFPQGYGEPHLYKYTLSLVIDEETVDKIEGRVGLREVRIIEKPFSLEAGTGYSFEFEINGQRIFCKGANWVPLEMWPGTIKDEQYSFYLQKAKEANFNMLRVWGGGLYEREIFYDLCDELGIMVWQDFMFASQAFPVDVLRAEIIKEADYQIRRLSRHSAMVIWCGCNEDIYSWQYPNEQGADTQSDVINANKSDKWYVNRYKDDPEIYTMLLRGMVSKLGLGLPYVESSPQSRDDYGNLPNSGNCHISSWKHCLFDKKGEFADFREFFGQVCSFNSEFCIQGPCSTKSLKAFMAPENYWPPNGNWTFHIQRGHRNMPHHEQTIFIAENIIGKIKSLQDYTKYGQAVHLEMMRAEFESARRNRTDSGGTMVWMYNDCWPTSNWSIIDYYKKPKPAYYAAKRACEAFLPIILEKKGLMEFSFSNESTQDLKLKIVYGQETLSGKTVWRQRKSLKSSHNSLVKFSSMEREKLEIGTGDYLYVDVIADGNALPRTVYFPDAWKDITWPKPDLEITADKTALVNGIYNTELTVTTDVFARLCHLLWHGDEQDNVWFDDNYFDICAGKSYKLTVQSPKELNLAGIASGHWWTEWE